MDKVDKLEEIMVKGIINRTLNKQTKAALQVHLQGQHSMIRNHTKIYHKLDALESALSELRDGRFRRTQSPSNDTMFHRESNSECLCISL